LREAGTLPTLGDKLVLFAMGIVCFGTALQVGFALMSVVQRWLARIALRQAAAG